MIPENIKGKASNTEESIEVLSVEHAAKIFLNAKNLLCDINRWATYSRVKLAATFLTDNEGTIINRFPKAGDFIRTDLVGPGSKQGDGYDWVRIIALEDLSNTTGAEEMFSIKVQPSSNPLSENQDKIAHFFSSDATNTFIIARVKNVVTVAVRGRNELVNIKSASTIDKIRNTAVGLGSAMGLSAIQWKLFLKGLLKHAMNAQ